MKESLMKFGELANKAVAIFILSLIAQYILLEFVFSVRENKTYPHERCMLQKKEPTRTELYRCLDLFQCAWGRI